MKNTTEKRRQPRVKLTGYTADLADGHFVYIGIVQDISIQGIRLHDLPDKFTFNGNALNVVISSQLDSTYYKLTASPQWRKTNGTSFDVGFNIIKSPASWKTFVQQIMPLEWIENNEEDIWDKYTSAKT